MKKVDIALLHKDKDKFAQKEIITAGWVKVRVAMVASVSLI